MRSKLSICLAIFSAAVYGSDQQAFERDYSLSECVTKKGGDGYTYKNCINPSDAVPEITRVAKLEDAKPRNSGIQIESDLKHLCLERANDSDQGSVLMGKCTNKPLDKQMIQLRPLKGTGEFINLITLNEYCIQSDDNGNLVQAYCQPNDPSQVWEQIFLNKSKSKYILRNYDADQCLTVRNETTTSGVTVSLYECSKTSSQIWLNHKPIQKPMESKPLLETPVQLSNGLNELTGTTSMCLDIDETTKGAIAILKPCKSRKEAGKQLLTFVTHTESPRLGIFRTVSGQCLEKSKKGYLIQKPCNGNKRQVFKKNSKGFYGGKERSIYNVGAHGNNCLDVQQSPTSDNVHLIATSCSSQPGQEWYNHNRD